MSGLFVFIAFLCFTIYYLILCFVLHNSLIIYWYSLGKTNFFQKRSFFSPNYHKSSLKIPYLKGSCLQFHEETQKHLKSFLQNRRFSKKHLRYILKAFKSWLNKLKSSQKQTKALKIYSTRLLYSIFQEPCRPFFNLHPRLW
jgi:biopolymer transport protein ExbB/TolQ